MIILAIETSCDETAIAVLKASGKKKLDFELLSNIVASQVKIHQKYGGVYPSLAKREHQRNLIPVLKKSLSEAKLLKSKIKNKKSKTKIKNQKFKTLEKILSRDKNFFKSSKNFLVQYEKPKIDVIAVTIGPGLEPCLWTGVNFAKALAFFWNLPIIPVNHIEAHIIVNWLAPVASKSKVKSQKSKVNNEEIKFPAIALVVSGGHTQLILMRDIGKYKIIGETRDDAAGECFDKTARVLGLPYPGGPAIAAEAAKLQTTNYKLQTKLPRPMMYSKDYDFSFSGLKTAVLYDFKKRSPRTRKSKQYIREMAHEIQQAINDVLIKKTIKAAKDFQAQTIILGGGVAANEELRKQLNYKLKAISYKLKFLVPPKIFCTDNAAMIAITAYFHLKCLNSEFKHFKKWKKIKAQANLRL